MNKLSLVTLLGLISIACALTQTQIDQRELRDLVDARPCEHARRGSNVAHPTNAHKYLRCVSRDSFWIEKCPDSLFYNPERRVCDWSVISETTTESMDIMEENDDIRNRAVLFKNNKTFHSHHRHHHVRVKITPDIQFPEDDDIEIESSNRRVIRPTIRKSSNFGNNGNSFHRFHNVENVEQPSEMNTDSLNFEEEPTTTRRTFTTRLPIRPRQRTTTERPVLRTTTERPILRTTTERPVIMTKTEERIIDVPRHNEEEVEEREHEREQNHEQERKEQREEEEEDNVDRPKLFRTNHIVTSTKPTFVRRRPVHHRRPVVEHLERVEESHPIREKFVDASRPEEIIEEEVPRHESETHEHVKESRREPISRRIPTRAQLVKQLAKEIPGARVVSIAGESVHKK